MSATKQDGRAAGNGGPPAPSRKLLARTVLMRVKLETSRRRLRLAEKRVEAIRRSMKTPAPAVYKKTRVKKARKARASEVGAFNTWEDMVWTVGSREGLRLLLDAGIVGRSFPQLAEPPADARVLVLVPHHDDDGIGAGGTLLLSHKAGSKLRLVYYTDGRTKWGALTPEDLVQLRAQEARNAWASTGAQLDFLGVPSGEDEIPVEAVNRLVEILDEHDPTHIFLPTFLEEPFEHRLLTRWLVRATERRPLDDDVELWGYQVTTRLPGNAVVDISDVRDEKFKLNQAWASQNSRVNYAEVANAQDGANAMYLVKARATLRNGFGQGEVFIRFSAPRYLQLARSVMALEDKIEDAVDDGSLALGGGRDAALADVPPPDFFVVGMQKSGSYWLTALLDAHPEVRCFPSRPGGADGTGEAHLFDILARVDDDYASFRHSMSRKLGGVFADLIPEEPPADEFEKGLLAQRLAERFSRFCEAERRAHRKRLVGEKTTETVHHPDLVRRLFPGVRKLAILRDPRDRTVSFHFHEQRKGRRDEQTIDRGFVERYRNRVRQDLEGLLALEDPVHLLTYEALQRDPASVLPGLLEFLGVEGGDAVIAAMIEQASFDALSGRKAGESDTSSHFRKGVVGDWQSMLSAEDAAWLVEELEPLTARVEERFGVDLGGYR